MLCQFYSGTVFLYICVYVSVLFIKEEEEEKEKKVTRAEIEPRAAAPSQPTHLDVSRSDHSAGSRAIIPNTRILLISGVTG